MGHFVLSGVVLGAWSVYNATHPSRQNHVANLAVKELLFDDQYHGVSLSLSLLPIDCRRSWNTDVTARLARRQIVSGSSDRRFIGCTGVSQISVSQIRIVVE